ncbi:hypothetical protein C8Q80DRAFT_878036 [Daedaleopsis nitida]|nr:hypothetical protein C8Q80DRAFT_878036 [Daedaleopsis nitida]
MLPLPFNTVIYLIAYAPDLDDPALPCIIHHRPLLPLSSSFLISRTPFSAYQPLNPASPTPAPSPLGRWTWTPSHSPGSPGSPCIPYTRRSVLISIPSAPIYPPSAFHPLRPPLPLLFTDPTADDFRPRTCSYPSLSYLQPSAPGGRRAHLFARIIGCWKLFPLSLSLSLVYNCTHSLLLLLHPHMIHIAHRTRPSHVAHPTRVAHGAWSRCTAPRVPRTPAPTPEPQPRLRPVYHTHASLSCSHSHTLAADSLPPPRTYSHTYDILVSCGSRSPWTMTGPLTYQQTSSYLFVTYSTSRSDTRTYA